MDESTRITGRRTRSGLAGKAAAALVATLAAAGLWTPAPAHAQAEAAVDLELALAVDVSRSIDAGEAALQREGYIAAFRDPAVIETITSGMLGQIAVGYYEWAGLGHIDVIVDWTLIDGEESALAFARALDRRAPAAWSRTSISGALEFARPWFDNNGFEGTRRVVDVSGDGPNNWGELVNVARDRVVAAGITINGLPILNDDGGMFSQYNIPDLDLYYRDCVIGGAGAFIVVANNFRDFARAVRRKLILEIAGRTPPAPRRAAGIVPAQAGREDRIGPPCDVGEQIWRNRFEP